VCCGTMDDSQIERIVHAKHAEPPPPLGSNRPSILFEAGHLRGPDRDRKLVASPEALT